MHKRLIVLIFITLCIAIAISAYAKPRCKLAKQALQLQRSECVAAELALPVELNALIIEADSFKEKKKPFLYYEAYKNKALLGYCFNTIDVDPNEKGYVGPMEILVAINKEGAIINLKIVKSNETPEYAKGISEPKFLNQFKGKGARDKFIIGEDIDAVTHATMSSKAIAGILKNSLNKMQEVIGLHRGDKQKEKAMPLERSGLTPKEAKYYKVIE